MTVNCSHLDNHSLVVKFGEMVAESVAEVLLELIALRFEPVQAVILSVKFIVFVAHCTVVEAAFLVELVARLAGFVVDRELQNSATNKIIHNNNDSILH